MNCHDSVAMWSSVMLYVLTFAVFGLLLGFAAVYDTNQEGQTGNSSSGETMTRQNVGNNTTQSSQSSSADANEESRQ
jgi:hypothetical protein